MKDYTGTVYGRLTVTRYSHTSSDHRHFWECNCACGKSKTISIRNLIAKRKPTRSCGCLQTESRKSNVLLIKHGDAQRGKISRLYEIWTNMKARCRAKRGISYRNYSSRGITVCKEWIQYSVFKEWAMLNGYNDNLTIERNDVNGNYEPDNCCFIPRKDQCLNARDTVYVNYRGNRVTLHSLLSESILPRGIIYGRLRLNWPIEKALHIPLQKKGGDHVIRG